MADTRFEDFNPVFANTVLAVVTIINKKHLKMIKEVTMYTVVCDGCGKDSNHDSGYAGWNDKTYAKDVAMEANWIEHKASHYCTDCYEYDDNDEVAVKHKQDICYKSNKPCVHDCKGLCRESC